MSEQEEKPEPTVAPDGWRWAGPGEVPEACWSKTFGWTRVEAWAGIHPIAETIHPRGGIIRRDASVDPDPKAAADPRARFVAIGDPVSAVDSVRWESEPEPSLQVRFEAEAIATVRKALEELRTKSRHENRPGIALMSSLSALRDGLADIQACRSTPTSQALAIVGNAIALAVAVDGEDTLDLLATYAVVGYTPKKR